MSTLSVGDLEGLAVNSNVVTVPTGHTLNVTDAAGLQIGGSAVVSAGLVFISRTTIGSAVSSVTVSDAFSADYDNYKIVFKVESASTGNYLEPTLGSATTGYYRVSWGGSGALYNASATAVVGYGNQNDSKFNDFLPMKTGGGGGVLEIQSPFLADQTFVQGLVSNTENVGIAFGYLNDTTSHTSITITTSTGTITGGTIDVYGYAKA